MARWLDVMWWRQSCCTHQVALGCWHAILHLKKATKVKPIWSIYIFKLVSDSTGLSKDVPVISITNQIRINNDIWFCKHIQTLISAAVHEGIAEPKKSNKTTVPHMKHEHVDGMGGDPSASDVYSLIPINGNSYKLVYFGWFRVFHRWDPFRNTKKQVELSSESSDIPREQTHSGATSVEELPNAFECTMMQRETFEVFFTNFWLYNCVFHQLQTAWPLTKVILDGFHLGW